MGPRSETRCPISPGRGDLFTATGSRGVGLGPWFGGRASPNLNWPQTAHEQCQNSSAKLAPCFRRSWSMGLGPWSFARYGRIEALSRHAPRVRISFAPPLAHCKPEMRSLTGPFFFLFQRGLAKPSDFRRLASGPKSVSERPASLSTRPSPKSRRIQKCLSFQVLAENRWRRS